MKVADRRDLVMQALVMQQRRDQLDIRIMAIMVPLHDEADQLINRVVEGTTNHKRLPKLREEIRTWPDSEGKRRLAYRVRKLLEDERFNQDQEGTP